MPPNDGVTPTDGPRRPTTAADFPRTGPFSLAAPGPRFAARAVDLLIVSFPALVYLAFAARYTESGAFEFGPLVWLGPAMFALATLYEFTGVATMGRTPGKMMFGLRVVRLADGRRPDASQALLRAMAPWIVIALPLGVLCVPGVIIAYGSATAGELHRGLADHAGGTLVISTR
jgi:uncharacterized RDD family membrane protein YckC